MLRISATRSVRYGRFSGLLPRTPAFASEALSMSRSCFTAPRVPLCPEGANPMSQQPQEHGPRYREGATGGKNLERTYDSAVRFRRLRISTCQLRQNALESVFAVRANRRFRDALSLGARGGGARHNGFASLADEEEGAGLIQHTSPAASLFSPENLRLTEAHE